MIIEIQKVTAHSRALVIKSDNKTSFHKATNNRDRFPEELITNLHELINEMHDHNYNMKIRDEERR